jgi:hypothetical protein
VGPPGIRRALHAVKGERDTLLAAKRPHALVEFRAALGPEFRGPVLRPFMPPSGMSGFSSKGSQWIVAPARSPTVSSARSRRRFPK